MAAARFIAPKMASMAGSTSMRAARPVSQTSSKLQLGTSQRSFSGTYLCHAFVISYESSSRQVLLLL